MIRWRIARDDPNGKSWRRTDDQNRVVAIIDWRDDPTDNVTKNNWEFYVITDGHWYRPFPSEEFSTVEERMAYVDMIIAMHGTA